jgi:hypothetical protein
MKKKKREEGTGSHRPSTGRPATSRHSTIQSGRTSGTSMARHGKIRSGLDDFVSEEISNFYSLILTKY